MNLKAPHIIPGTLAAAALIAAVATTVTTTVLRAQDAGRRSEFNPTTSRSAAPSAGVTPAPTAVPTAPAPGASTRPAVNWNGGFGATSSGRSNSNNTDGGSSRQDYSRNRRDSRRGGRERAGPTTSKTLSDAYSLVLTKSIFSRNRQTTAGSDPVSYPTGPTAPTNSPLVFNGVVEADGAMVAFVEDTGGGQISQYRLGDRIGRAGGRIVSISLDALEIDNDGKRHQVRVGQTLDGGEAPSLTERAVISNGPAESGTPSPTPAGPNSDILAKLKARRAAELAGRGAPPGAPGGTPPGGTPPSSTPPPGGTPQR